MIKAKIRKLNKLDGDNCELRENVSYVTTSHYKQWGGDSCKVKEEDGCKEEDMSANGELKALELEQASPLVPFRKYLQEDKVCRQIQ